MARQDMRKVEMIILSDAALDTVTDALEVKNVDFAVSDQTHGRKDDAMVTFTVPVTQVERIQKYIDTRLPDQRSAESVYTIVTDPETVTSPRLDSGSNSDFREPDGPARISRDELHSRASDMLPDLAIYTILTAIAAIVATAGVLLDSVSVLVGSMVIAPLIGPPMATSVATVIDDERLFLRAARHQLAGGGVAVLVSVAFAFLAKRADLAPSGGVSRILEMSNYTSPAVLIIVVAVGAGVAGAISMSTSGTVELVGVMMAAALVPPIAIMAVGLAYFQFWAALGSATVVLVNLFSINLGATLSLWYLGYHETAWNPRRSTRSTILRRVLVIITMLGSLALGLTILAHGSGLTDLPGI
ncbi:TIGR00341 family protein [Halocalculus aciditolerans]|uniref:TIGR00341 family protein n=1 Tax=Halocalculus aciditolerans TaxID=1383812 RepID=A0A830FCH3_9EURY|nr:TIGR00341 family protein [Halocalculus aciditolerans]GGL61740.1 hypothetical protein GCM10009039_19910 [Halocalculus aciditolerans]